MEYLGVSDNIDALIEETHGRGISIPPDRPEIIVLCGSTRFMEEYKKWNRELTLQHKIVLSVGRSKVELSHLGNKDTIAEGLDELHLRKIDLADRVFILNIGGYIGESTAKEIMYAMERGKPVEYLEPIL